MSAVPKPVRYDNIGEMIRQLGVSARRIRAYPWPGQATEKDVIRIHDKTDRLYELVDGVLVEKVRSFPELALTCDLIKMLGNFLDDHPLGSSPRRTGPCG